jgi:hypothetical protein
MQKKFVIATWFDPPIQALPNSHGQDLESFQLASEAHFNLLTATQGFRIWTQDENDYRLTLAADSGLMSLVADERNNWEQVPNIAFNLNSAVQITNHYTCLDQVPRDAMYGYFVLHEPCRAEFDMDCLIRDASGAVIADNETDVNAYRSWLQHFKTNDPEKLAFVILRSYASYAGQDRTLYEDYLNTFLKGPSENTTPDVVAFDLYPFGTLYAPSGFDPDYYYTIKVIRDKAGTRPFWQWVLATNQNSSTDAQYLDDPDENQLRFQVFNPIAYGAKGIGYYTYAPGPDNVSQPQQALIDINGNRTTKFGVVSTINNYLEQIVGPAVMASKNLGAFHKSAVFGPSDPIFTPSNEQIPPESLITGITGNNPLIADVSDANVLVGVFEGTDAQYGLVVNTNYSTEIHDVQVTLHCNCSRVTLAPSVVNYNGDTAYQPLQAQYDPHSNMTKFTIIGTLAGGEGRMFKVDVGAPALIRSNFGQTGNFEVVVPQWDPQQETEVLCHYYRDNDTSPSPGTRWHKSVCFGRDVMGSPALIQSKSGFYKAADGSVHYPLGRNGNFEVLVPQWDPSRQTRVLCHYWRDNDDPNLTWHEPDPSDLSTQCFAPGIESSPALIQSNFGLEAFGQTGNFEVVVQGAERNLCHWWRDNNTSGFPWNESECFSDEGSSGPAMIQSHFSNQALGIKGEFRSGCRRIRSALPLLAEQRYQQLSMDQNLLLRYGYNLNPVHDTEHLRQP